MATIKKGKPKGHYETVDNLLAAINMVDCTPGHIHEGAINQDTGYPGAYYVCDYTCDEENEGEWK
jgi:hypothetical protein